MKIAVTRFSSLGDIILLLPMLRILRLNAPDSYITAITLNKYAELFKREESIDEVVEIRGDSLKELKQLIQELNKRKFDIFIDAHNVLRSNLIYKFIKAPKKIQLKKEGLKKFLLINLKINLYTESQSLFGDYMNLAEKVLGQIKPQYPHGLNINQKEKETVTQLLNEKAIDTQKLICIAPGARWNTKRWPEKNFAGLIGKLKSLELQPVLIGGKSDTTVCIEIKNLIETNIPDFSGKLSIFETAELLGRSKLLVTNDSAPLHLSELMNTPVVAIFGPTVREFGYFPRLKESIAIEKRLWCRPCSRNGARICFRGDKPCLTSISVDDVLNSVIQTLNNRMRNEQ